MSAASHQLELESGDHKTYKACAFGKDPLTCQADLTDPIVLTGGRVQFFLFEGADDEYVPFCHLFEVVKVPI